MSHLHYKRCGVKCELLVIFRHSKLGLSGTMIKIYILFESKIQVCNFNWANRATGQVEQCGRYIEQWGGRATGQVVWQGGRTMGQQSNWVAQ